MKIHQLDVTAAFLNGDMEEEIHMKQAESYAEIRFEDFLCCLKISYYGLKHSPICWNQKLDKCLKRHSFAKPIVPCVYIGENAKGEKFIVCLYVDDLLLVNKEEDELVQVKRELSQMFDVKDLGELHYFLGVEFKRQEGGSVWMGQKSYAKQTLPAFGVENCSPTNTLQ